MKLIINLPAFNEEEKIMETIKKIPRHFSSVDEVFIQVIDDGSRDKTVQAAKEAGADWVFSHPINRGIGITFRTAVEKALENGADIMVNMDADGQFDAEDIIKLIRPIIENRADLVSASRFGHKKADNMPKIKHFLNKTAAWIIGKFMQYPIADLTCGFRAYSRESLLRLNLSGGFTYTQEVIIDAIGKNLKIEWVPATVTYFENRQSRVVKNIFHYIGNSGKIILKTVRDVRPMRFFGIPSLILIIASLFFFVYFLLMYLETLKITPYRNILLLAVTLFLIGIQFLIFAFIADMIKTTRKSIEDQTYLIKKEKYDKH
ncbi:MAG: glycosyltransferase family 2 protein [Candidatus Moranbacteria bacterium CG06_land_8_20_14_3_00_40_12]|nr:MAG: glycosyltransferase family 2 protein [Candidatus Moranbacteria bacterium CG06_land_8_20_14_3_00_40_12]